MSAPSGRPSGAAPSLWLIVACLASVYIVWGTTYYALKVGVHGTDPYFLIGTRFLVAGALLMAWCRWRGTPLPDLRQWGGSATLGLLMLVLGLGSVAVAEQRVSSGAAVALISMMPLATALCSGILEQWPARRDWFAIALGAIGTLVMVTGHDLRASPQDTLLILFGTFVWAFGTVLSRRLEVSPGAMGFAAEMVAGGVIALALSAALGESWVLPDSSAVWWAWGYLVVFGSLIAFSAYRVLVERVSPTLAATYAYVNPPVALLVGWGLGNESFSTNVLIGLPVVLVAVAWHAWPQLRASRASAAGRVAAEPAVTSLPRKEPARSPLPATD